MSGRLPGLYAVTSQASQNMRVPNVTDKSIVYVLATWVNLRVL